MVALNFYEAEYIALNEVGKQAVWLQQILKELGLIDYSPFPALIYKDNVGTIAVVENPEFHRRTKYIDVRYDWVRNAIGRKLIEVEHIAAGDQAADEFIKACQMNAFRKFKDMISMPGGGWKQSTCAK